MPHLHFKGRSFVQNHHLAVPFHELIPVKTKGLSKKPSLHDNLILRIEFQQLPFEIYRRMEGRKRG